MSDMTATIGHPPVEVYFGENTQTAVAAATAAEAAAVAAQAFTNYRATRAEGVADFAVGEYFSSDETGELRVYKRIAGSPFYQDQGDEAAPLTKKTFNEQSARITTRALLPTIALGGGVYAADVNAFYEYDAASSATVDDWAVIAALGGVGRWLLISDGVTVHASGSDDAPTLMAAGNAMGLAGKKLFTPDALYLLDTKWSWGRDPLHLVAHRGVTFECGLTPDGSPATAGFYCSAGGDAIVATTTLASANTVGSDTISVDAEPDVGDYVRIRDNISGTVGPTVGFTGATYLVKAVSGSGPYTVTVDRPVQFQVEDGDECVILSDVAKGHIIEGFPTISGTGTRLFEFVGTMHCRVQAIFRPTTITDVVASFDVFGYDNHFLPGCECYENGSGATDGIYLESQESSSIAAKVRGFDAGGEGVGVSIFHGIDCRDESEVSGCGVGAALRGYGPHGCFRSELAGRYDGNIAQGASVVNASRDCRVTGSARYNPINLAIGDNAGGNVTRTTIEGDFSDASNIGIWVNPSAIGTIAGAIDTTNSPKGILANSSIGVASSRHHGTAEASTGGVVVATDDAQVSIAVIDWSIINVVNGVRASGDSVVTIDAGLYTADGGSNLFRPGGNSHVMLGGAVRATTDDGTGIGIYFDSTTAKVTLHRGSDLSGMTTLTGGSAGYIDRDGRVSTNIGDSSTTAVATQEILKEFTFPAAALKIGQKLRIRAWGSVAANANTKTVTIYFGESSGLSAVTSVAVSTGAAYAWFIDIEIWLTGAATQDYAARIDNGNSAQVVRGTLTEALSNANIVSLRGTNGTASAGDIVARGLEVEVVA